MTALVDLANIIIPIPNRHKVLALLSGYFDESGIHARAPATVISGFVGPIDAWEKIVQPWRKALGEFDLEVFHYSDLRNILEEWKRDCLCQELARILETSDLRVVSAAFQGNWDRCVQQTPELSNFYPSSYALCFELCCAYISSLSEAHWQNEDVALMFSHQTEHIPKAIELFCLYKDNDRWPHIVSATPGDPRKFVQLQAADMITYETYQSLMGADKHAWKEWPLLMRLIERGAGVYPGALHDEETVVRMLKDANRIRLKRPPKGGA
jgi:hypothetical protein